MAGFKDKFWPFWVRVCGTDCSFSSTLECQLFDFMPVYFKLSWILTDGDRTNELPENNTIVKWFDLLFVYVPFLICLAYSCQTFSWRKPSDGDRKHGCYWAGTCDPPFTCLAVRSARPIGACLFIVWGVCFSSNHPTNTWRKTKLNVNTRIPQSFLLIYRL